MTYFDFFDLKPMFILDEIDLKKRFLRNSKKFHPDFHTLENDEKQAEILELASYNTEAYKILSDFDSRMDYLLDLNGLKKEEGQEKMPQDFLMEMMEINETLMELQFDFDEKTYQKVITEVENQEKENFFSIERILQSFDNEHTTHDDLKKIKIFYLKKKYLLRIQKTCRNFAPH
jgi:molecular chaperone HscB